MAVMTLDCPHCSTRDVSFQSLGQRQFVQSPLDWLMALFCAHCELGVVAHFRGTPPPPPDRTMTVGGLGRTVSASETIDTEISPGDYPLDPRDGGYDLIATYPEARAPTAPPHTPENVVRFYVQAEDNLRLANWDAAGGMYRSALDVGTRALDASLTGRLVDRIDTLADNLAITPAMREWAHEIRLGGNVALHEEEPFSEAEAAALKTFTELFLTYAFMLPGMLEERRNPPPPEETEGETEAG